jgi:hypothetical protein
MAVGSILEPVAGSTAQGAGQVVDNLRKRGGLGEVVVDAGGDEKVKRRRVNSSRK